MLGGPRDVVPGRGQRRGRGQRHAPDDRRVSRHPRPRPPRGRRGPAARPGPPAHRLPRTTGAGRPSTARRCPRPCTCWPGSCGMRLPWRARLDAVRLGLAARFGRPPAGLTLTEWFDRLGQGEAVRRLLWGPLATAILNETPDRAAAILFYNVYRAAFLESAAASRLVFLRRGYGRLLDRLGAYLEARGGRILRRARAERDRDRGRRRRRRRLRAAARRARRHRARRAGHERPHRRRRGRVRRALVGPAAAPARALARRSRVRGRGPADRIAHRVHRDVARPGRGRPRRWSGLRDCEVEWVFDKGRLYGREGAPSTSRSSSARRTAARRGPTPSWPAIAEAALRRYFPAMAGARVTRTLILREADATFSCDPASEAIRPGAATPVRGLVPGRRLDGHRACPRPSRARCAAAARPRGGSTRDRPARRSRSRAGSPSPGSRSGSPPTGRSTGRWCS